jgi:hypothetical protein
MSAGISFGSDLSWLVRSSLAEPVLERVARALAPADPALAEWIEQGIYVQAVSLARLPPSQREQVRRAVVEVARELLADDGLLASLDETPDAVTVPDRDANRRQTVQRLLDLAESDEARRFAAGDAS